MLEFDATNPFPLLPELTARQYPDAKRHAAAVDVWLGLGVENVERRLRDPQDGAERWVGRHSSVFLTPYVELRYWLEELEPQVGQTVVDLGAGYGRLGFVLARHFPEVSFLGFELVPERVRAGAEALLRFPAPKARLLQTDLADLSWRPPKAEFYFLYDYGTKAAIGKTLHDLREVAATQGIVVIGRGRAVRDQIQREHPWLGSVHQPIHRAHYSIYRSFS